MRQTLSQITILKYFSVFHFQVYYVKQADASDIFEYRLVSQLNYSYIFNTRIIIIIIIIICASFIDCMIHIIFVIFGLKYIWVSFPIVYCFILFILFFGVSGRWVGSCAGSYVTPP
jgi:hypothetical protein